MMEFLLSKLWMVIAGLAVMAVVIASFGSLDDRTTEDGLRDEMASASNILEEMHGCPAGTTVRIAPDIPADSIMRVGNGSLWLVRDGPDLVIPIRSKIVAMEDGIAVPFVETRPGGHFLATRVVIDGVQVTIVQAEKMKLSSFMASTNLRTSSSVLYR